MTWRLQVFKFKSFGTNDFDVPGIAVALLIVGVVIGLSGLILSIFASATANSIANPQPGTLAYNLTHPLVNGMISFYGFYPTISRATAIPGTSKSLVPKVTLTNLGTIFAFLTPVPPS